MYLEKAKPEEFEDYYRIKCEPFVNYWSRGDEEIPPRENLYRFYMDCMPPADGMQSAGGMKSADRVLPGNKGREIYLIQTEEREIAGYLYFDHDGDTVDLPIALGERFTGKGLAKQAILAGLALAGKRGYRRSRVEIREDNAASIRMYTSCGYRRGEKTRDMYVAATGQIVALYAYEREIWN